MRRTSFVLRSAAAATFLGIAASSAQAQQPHSSVAGFGMGNNYIAAARGYEAVMWNPALLGLPGNKGFTIGGLMPSVFSGLDPVDFSDFAKVGGELITDQTKQEWLAQVRTNGRQRGDVDGGVTILGMSMGPVGLQLGVSGNAVSELNGDAFEAIFFGNAGATGQPRNLNFGGSKLDGGGFGTAAVSFGLPIPVKLTNMPNEAFSIGVTGKYVHALGYANARDAGSATTPNNVTIRFPLVYSDDFDSGNGIGVDVGAAWQAGDVTISGSVKNALNTFEYDASGFKCRAGTASFDGTTSTSNFNEVPCTGNFVQQAERANDRSFKPSLAIGAAWRMMPSLLITADARSNTGNESEAIVIGQRTGVGIGAEFSGLSFLPLRAGITALDDGVQVAGGVGLRFGGFELGVAGSLHNRAEGRELGAMISLISIR